ncbi:hypothetical protein HZS_5845 [Henneguya salminicola]|nr:hypothetical protein HZS_5845 [Henneguya salminicola]
MGPQIICLNGGLAKLEKLKNNNFYQCLCECKYNYYGKKCQLESKCLNCQNNSCITNSKCTQCRFGWEGEDCTNREISKYKEYLN